MSLLLKLPDEGLGIWKIEESPAELLEMLEDKDSYRPFLQSCTSESRRAEWLAVRVLLKMMTGLELTIRYRENGAPYLLDFALQLSISHTKGYAAVLLSRESAAGIDIEAISERAIKAAPRFMSEPEISTLTDEHRLQQCLLYWSAKETLFKLAQLEEVDFREHLHISPFPYAPGGVIRAQETRTTRRQTADIRYLVTAAFVLTYAKAGTN